MNSNISADPTINWFSVGNAMVTHRPSTAVKAGDYVEIPGITGMNLCRYKILDAGKHGMFKQVNK